MNYKLNSVVKIIIVLALVALAGFGGYYIGTQNNTVTSTVATTEMTTMPAVTPTPTPSATTVVVDPTASWKMYTNNTFKFNIKYPNQWKVLSDTIQKDTTVESNPGESLTLSPLSSTTSGYKDNSFVSLIVNHGGFDPAIGKNTYDAKYENGKLALSNKQVNTSDVYQPEDGTYNTGFSIDGTNYSIAGAHLTDSQFTQIVTSFSLVR